METEIKTLIYRDRAADGKKSRRLTSGRKKLYVSVSSIILAVAFVAVLVGGVGKVGAEGKDGADNLTDIYEMRESAADGQNADNIGENDITSYTMVNPVAEYVQNPVETIEAETVQNANDENTNENISVAESIDAHTLEERIVLRLLAETEYDEEDYFPATLGLDETEDKYADLPTHVDAFEEMTSHMTAPEDMPSSLVFKYNPKMMLDLSADEIEILERIVEAEATGQTVYGKMLVANVVLNRINSRYFANTVKGVVFEKIGGSVQFSPVKDGRYYTVEVTDGTREAVERVLAGEDYSQGALYFFQRTKTSKTKATWFDRNLKFLFKYGCHEFFTEFKN